jgi:glycerol-3-phosphate acyltransferase PlsY
VCREFGIRSKNPRAALALVGDIAKAFAALAIFAPHQPANIQWMMGIAAVVGHCWNPFLGWNGGKGVATTSGMLLYLLNWHLMLCLILYPVLRAFGRWMGWKQEGAVSSMTTMFVLSTLVLMTKGTAAGLFAYATLAIVVVRHRGNIREILSSAA